MLYNVTMLGCGNHTLKTLCKEGRGNKVKGIFFSAESVLFFVKTQRIQGIVVFHAEKTLAGIPDTNLLDWRLE